MCNITKIYVEELLPTSFGLRCLLHMRWLQRKAIKFMLKTSNVVQHSVCLLFSCSNCIVCIRSSTIASQDMFLKCAYSSCNIVQHTRKWLKMYQVNVAWLFLCDDVGCTWATTLFSTWLRNLWCLDSGLKVYFCVCPQIWFTIWFLMAIVAIQVHILWESSTTEKISYRHLTNRDLFLGIFSVDNPCFKKS